MLYELMGGGTHEDMKRLMVVWRSGSALVSINEVNLPRAQLVLRWLTMSGFNSQCRTFISVRNQPARLTQPGHPFLGALRLGSKGRYGSCVGGR